MHQKHPKLSRPALGHFSRAEFSLVGTTCERIEAIMDTYSAALSCIYRVLCVTGVHEEPEVPTALRFGKQLCTCGPAESNTFDDRLLGSQFDLVLVNGNHYPADSQIIFIDANKAGTLERRKHQLTNVVAIVHCDEDWQIPAWLAVHLAEAAMQPVITDLKNADGLIAGLYTPFRTTRALVLAGGKSQRMGQDKSKIEYREGKTEIERLAEICAEAGIATSVSVREADPEAGHGLPQIEDRFVDLGPLGAICSAFMSDPDARWLVLACDLPLLDKETIEKLIYEGDSRKYATAVRGPGQEWPEPLIAIYEPRAYQRLLQFLSLGYACPRKFLINSEVKVIDLVDGAPIMNANTPEDREEVLRKIK